MKKTVSALAALFLFVLAATLTMAPLAAQEGSHSGKQAEETLTGCLQAGDSEGHYVLVTEDGDEVQVNGDAAIGKHVGHKVKLTGYFEDDDGERVFEAKKIEHISADCE